jgi:hypothetical protein
MLGVPKLIDLFQPLLERMIGKANDIYTRWSNGQEVPTIILRHNDDYGDEGTPVPTLNPFEDCHRSLTQCIVECHDRAKYLFPQRKPCQCNVKSTSTICPPSHSWAPPPNLEVSTPVLPELYTMQLAKGIQESQLPPLSPTSKYSVDTINFEVGALNPGSADQSWMAWF